MTLHVPAASVDVYKAVEPWKSFGKIVALPTFAEITPLEEGAVVSFDQGITEEKDLTNAIIDNVYVTLNTEADDGYDTERKCLVLNSTVTERQLKTIANKNVTDETVKRNYKGLVFELPSCEGTISITAQTKGNRTLNVKIGDEEAQASVPQTERQRRFL